MRMRMCTCMYIQRAVSLPAHARLAVACADIWFMAVSMMDVPSTRESAFRSVETQHVIALNSLRISLANFASCLRFDSAWSSASTRPPFAFRHCSQISFATKGKSASVSSRSSTCGQTCRVSWVTHVAWHFMARQSRHLKPCARDKQDRPKG